ncbi:hypothetical protein BGS_0783 [Beggiatoa sp. SS]|nr:hypothetical protein BGS_0783 [Beggiatoa sp. SS]
MSKQAVFSIETGLAQILAYMLANEYQKKPCFGGIRYNDIQHCVKRCV